MMFVFAKLQNRFHYGLVLFVVWNIVLENHFIQPQTIY